MIKRDKKEKRLKIKKSIRRKISGTGERPRLSVYRSLNNIYAQLIDDTKGTTLVQVSTLSPGLKDELASASAMKKSERVGEELAKQAKEKNIATVVFDRSGYRYHGRIKALANAARKGGLHF